MRELLAEVTAALEQGRPCVYCSVVETRGSTPQKAGAAMLVLPDGTQHGTLGGGCVEAEVRRKALHVLAHGGRPEVVSFCLDDDYGWDDGLICGGRMTILADPLLETAHAATDYYQRYHRLVQAGQGCCEAVVLAADGKAAGGRAVGSRYLFGRESEVVAQLATAPPPAALIEQLPNLSDRPWAGTQGGVAYLPHLPRITLLVVGGGHVGHAVARLASEVDFDIWILDDRERYASAERFPMVRRRLVGDIGRTLKELAPTLDASTYAIIVTRGHNHDEEALYHLAPTAASYVGMIGSKRKIKMIFEDLVAKGIAEETLQRIHAPLGYDIGSQTVPEIAVSIVAELIASRNLRPISTASRQRVPQSLSG